MLSLLNKERVVFLAAVVIFLIGLATLLGRAPLTLEEPELPLLPPPLADVEMKTLRPLFPTAGPRYVRGNPFSLGEDWAPPKPGRLSDLPPIRAALAVPRTIPRPGERFDVYALQTKPPEEVAPVAPEEEGEGLEEEGVGEGTAE